MKVLTWYTGQPPGDWNTQFGLKRSLLPTPMAEANRASIAPTRYGLDLAFILKG